MDLLQPVDFGLEQHIKHKLVPILSDIYPDNYINLITILLKKDHNTLLYLIDNEMDKIYNEIDDIFKMIKSISNDTFGYKQNKIKYLKDIIVGSRAYGYIKGRDVPYPVTILKVNIPYVTVNYMWQYNEEIEELLFSKINLNLFCTKCSISFQFFETELNFNNIVCDKCKQMEVKPSFKLLLPSDIVNDSDEAASSQTSDEVLSSQDSLSEIALSQASDEVLSSQDSLSETALSQDSDKVIFKEDSISEDASSQASDEVLSSQGPAEESIAVQHTSTWIHPSDEFFSRLPTWKIIKNKKIMATNTYDRPGRFFGHKGRNIKNIQEITDTCISLDKQNKTTVNITIRGNIQNIIKSILIIECIVEYNGSSINGWHPDFPISEELNLLFNKILAEKLYFIFKDEFFQKDKSIEKCESNTIKWKIRKQQKSHKYEGIGICKRQYVGKIAGVKGQNIKHITKITNANIELDREAYLNKSEMHQIQITGTKIQIENAIKEINKVIPHIESNPIQKPIMSSTQDTHKNYCESFIMTCTNETESQFLIQSIFGTIDSNFEVLKYIGPNTNIFLYNTDTSELHGIFRGIAPPQKNIIQEGIYESFPSQIPIKRIFHGNPKTVQDCFIGPCTPENNSVLLELWNCTSSTHSDYSQSSSTSKHDGKSWQCPSCTYENPELVLQCEICYRVKQ